ncbi:hypothetical protein NliqN6_2134 [Naganishia liquefaciens]|uniref:DUF7923 domain-containing protein n=1 Tax=Naganishia liquefaciens TaxID=104408 RepID=A0A8H3TR86_9TREE|nr:hypothetical protein NliqN6_2134 [Naganishia liquefaciens]
MSSHDFTGRITVDDWQEYQNLKANFHRYTDCYERERQALLSRIDDLQIANVRLQDKVLIQAEHNKLCEQQSEHYDSVTGGRSLNRRASLYDGSWSKSVPSTMVSPFAPTIFSPTVSLTKAGKPSLAVSIPIPDNSSLAFSTNSNASQLPISVTVEPTTWSTTSPFSAQSLSTPWQSREDENSAYYEFKLTDSQPKAELEEVSLAMGSWADSEFGDDDAPPPATATSAPAGSFPAQNENVDQNLRYAMVLIDVSHVMFPEERVLQGRQGGYAFIEDLHRSITAQLAKQNLPSIVDPLMIRMIVRRGEYGNLKNSSITSEQMDDFCLGMRTHTSSLPIEEVPNEKHEDSTYALLCKFCQNF